MTSRFPANEYVQRLVNEARRMQVSFATSPVKEQWLYHPEQRTIYVWEDDLTQESLSYIVVILAHELGHAIDFDTNPKHYELCRGLHWAEVPDEIEIAAFVQGFNLLKRLWIPVSLDAYEMMIDPSIAGMVRQEIETNHSCCLLSSSATYVTPGAGGQSEAAS